jgi:glycine cleavage system protein P-like pyridoxal-binding family
VTSRLPGFALTHPLQPEDTVQGNLYLMYTLQEWLKEIVGLAGVTLQPQLARTGELTACSSSKNTTPTAVIPTHPHPYPGLRARHQPRHVRDERV